MKAPRFRRAVAFSGLALAAFCALSAALPVLQVLTPLKSGKAPYGMQVSKDGRKLYVANFASDEVGVLDLSDPKGKMERFYEIREPIDLALSPDEAKLFVLNFRPGMIEVVSTSDGKVIDNIKVGGSPISVTLSPRGDRIFAVNWGRSQNGHVDVIDVETHEVSKTVPVGVRPVAAAVGNNGDMLYVVNGGSNTITRIDLPNYQIHEFPTLPNPDGIAVSADSKRIYVVGANSPDIVMLDAASMKEVRRATVGSSPATVSVHPSGWVMTADKGSGTFSLLDGELAGATKAVVGKSPNDVVLSPDGKLAYVSLEKDNRIAVIKLE